MFLITIRSKQQKFAKTRMGQFFDANKYSSLQKKSIKNKKIAHPSSFHQAIQKLMKEDLKNMNEIQEQPVQLGKIWK